VRDKLAAGRSDGAALLAPMPLASALGLDPIEIPIQTLAALNQGGSGFCVSPELYARLAGFGLAANPAPAQYAQALKQLIEAERGSRPPITLAHVYPHSDHHYELRYWLGSPSVWHGHCVSQPVQAGDGLGSAATQHLAPCVGRKTKAFIRIPPGGCLFYWL
jgi:hypothetical protein